MVNTLINLILQAFSVPSLSPKASAVIPLPYEEGENAMNNRDAVIEKLKSITGPDWVLTELEHTLGYLYDETEPLLRPQADETCVVVKPEKPEEIAAIMAYATENHVPVFPRGGGTGLCGAAIPTLPGIVLSLERLNKIVELDEDNLMITVEAGVTLEQLNAFLSKENDLFFPVHPGDEGAQVGGMAVENAGGVGAVKHGIMRNHIKGMEVVLPTGEVVMMGGKLLKNNMGYDLLHLMIGSEGTLGVVTKVVLRLYPRLAHKGTLLISFDTRQAAAKSVSQMLKQGMVPLAMEYIDRVASQEAAAHLGLTWPADKGSVDLMLILEEATEDDLFDHTEKIVDICDANGAVDSLIAETGKEQKVILDIRSNVYTSFKEKAADAIDMAVPPAHFPAFLDELMQVVDQYGTQSPTVGHIGDGNIHNIILMVDGKLPDYFEEMRQAMYEVAIRYGGTVSAEHGTGRTRKAFMALQFSPREIQIMQLVKRAFDPAMILNPGVFFDESGNSEGGPTGIH